MLCPFCFFYPRPRSKRGSGSFLGALGSRTDLHQQRPPQAGPYWVIVAFEDLPEVLRSLCHPALLFCLPNSAHGYPSLLLTLEREQGPRQQMVMLGGALGFWGPFSADPCPASNCSGFAPGAAVSCPARRCAGGPGGLGGHHVRRGAGAGGGRGPSGSDHLLRAVPGWRLLQGASVPRGAGSAVTGAAGPGEELTPAFRLCLKYIYLYVQTEPPAELGG